MTLCGMCGNDYDSSGSCPYCGSFQHSISTGRSRRKRRVITVNLEQGRPTVDEAIEHLDREIAAARMKRVPLLRLIHGYGSSGEGGAIKDAVRRHLAGLVRRRTIRSFCAGDDYSEHTNAGRALLASYPSLRASLRTDRKNPGITFVDT